MLYTVANEGWLAGSSIVASETRLGLYRTRSEAEAIAAGRRLLAVSVRYDPERGLATSTHSTTGEWSAPAIIGPSGGVTVLATIPKSLVQVIGPPTLRLHTGHAVPGRLSPRRREQSLR